MQSWHRTTSSTIIIGSGPFASRAQARTTLLYKPSFWCNVCRKLLANSKRQQASRPVLWGLLADRTRIVPASQKARSVPIFPAPTRFFPVFYPCLNRCTPATRDGWGGEARDSFAIDRSHGGAAGFQVAATAQTNTATAAVRPSKGCGSRSRGCGCGGFAVF
jgi:hypothetical protein